MHARIEIPEDKIAEFCRNNHIRRLALFGSVLRDDFTPDSDVDILVEFEVGHTPGLAFFTMQRELSEILGRKSDLDTDRMLNLALVRLIEIIGEAAARVPNEFRCRHRSHGVKSQTYATS